MPEGPRILRGPRRALLFAGGLAFALLLAWGAGRGREAAALKRERVRVALEADREAAAIELSVNRRLVLVSGLRAFAELTWGRPSFDSDFDRYASRLITSTPGVRAVQYVVGGTIRRIYPLAGNEAAVGFDLYRHPDSAVVADLGRAERSNTTVLSGPVQLVQGGLGLIAREAARDSRGRLLAVVAVVLDLPPVLADAGFERRGGLVGALRDAEGRVIVGPDSLFRGPHVTSDLELLDRRWQLAAAPAAGWLVAARPELWLLRAQVFLLAVLGEAVGVLLLTRGMAARRARRESTLRQAERKYADLFQLSPDGVVVTRIDDGSVLEVNDAFVTLSGWSRDQLLGQTTLALGLWARPEERSRIVDLVRTARRCDAEAVHLGRRDGAELEVEFSARLASDGPGATMVCIVRDVSEKRRLERQLAQAQRMEAIGRLAGGVAHDFNNILTAIVAAAEMARDLLPEGDPARDEAGEILVAARRAADLTRQLLAFARRSVVAPRRIELNHEVEAAGKLLRRIIGDDIRLDASLTPDLPLVRIDPTQLQQVLLNLAVNARDAMPSGGTLRLATARAQDGVQLQVSDTGIGIPAEDQPFIFEPFFTTKAAGKGTGLGLATVYGVVQQAGGRIDVASRIGEGARFTISFPEAEDAGDGEEPAETGAVRVPGGAATGERVLVAEDDPQVRSVACRILAGLGYEVIAAGDGTEALALAQAAVRPIGLLLTDVVMPGMSGVDLARRVTALHPQARVLYMSGYLEDYAALSPALEAGAILLSKPYSPGELAAAVRRTLGDGDWPQPGAAL